jgi:chitodextrinase
MDLSFLKDDKGLYQQTNYCYKITTTTKSGSWKSQQEKISTKTKKNCFKAERIPEVSRNTHNWPRWSWRPRGTVLPGKSLG